MQSWVAQMSPLHFYTLSHPSSPQSLISLSFSLGVEYVSMGYTCCWSENNLNVGPKCPLWLRRGFLLFTAAYSRLADVQASGDSSVSHLATGMLGLQAQATDLALCGCWDLNAHPHPYWASGLSTEPHLQPRPHPLKCSPSWGPDF